jgi:outer membrane protein assembly factor BamE (lipoprotein component of BamABCDE complex)
MKFYTRAFLVFLGSLSLNACVHNYEYTGLKINSEDYNTILKNKMSQDQLTEFVGSPTFISELGGHTWYYVYTVTDKVAFFRPELVDEEVVAIKFKEDGSFVKMEKYNHADISKFSYSEDSTPTLGTESNPLQQILRNIQKYSVPSLSKKKAPGA